MAIVSKKKKVLSAPVEAPEEKKTSEKKVVTKKATKAPEEKKTVTKKVVKEVEEAPVTEKKTVAKGGKKMSLTGNTKSAKSFEIKEGSQATQEAFIDKYYKKLQALGYDITKEQVKNLKKAYSETLKEVTDVASYQDTDANLYYARRFIKTRVTEPPKAKDGLKTLMKGHYELKVRKLLGEESDFKFFGDLSEDGEYFITTDGDKIPLNEENEKSSKKSTSTKKVKTPVKEEEPEEEEEEVIEEEVEEEVEEESTSNDDDDDDDFDELDLDLDDDDEE